MGLPWTLIEVSDGTIDLSVQERHKAIAQARQYGFGVLSEVGKKDPDEKIDSALLVSLIRSDLEAGVLKVIVEGRESGQGVVIYDKKGNVKVGELEALVDGLSNPDCLIWEAPLKNQQHTLITRFGPNVNLGNVAPADILALEAMRCGLRGDTLKSAIKPRDYTVPAVGYGQGI